MNKTAMLGVIFVMFLVSEIQAQSYGTSIGLRLGNNQVSRTVGLSYKYRIQKNVTLEGILQSDFQHNTTFHAMIMRHRGIISKRFNFYAGTGLSLGREESIQLLPETNTELTTFGNTTIGADLLVGIEFTLLKHSFSLDYKPNFNLVGREPWYRGQVGVTARTVLLTGAKQNKKKRKRARAKKQEEKTKAKEARLKDKNEEEKPWLENLFKKKDKH